MNTLTVQSPNIPNGAQKINKLSTHIHGCLSIPKELPNCPFKKPHSILSKSLLLFVDGRTS